MLKRFVFLITFVALSASAATSGRVICYYSSSAADRPDNGKFTADDIDPSLCTHIVYDFVGINDDGSVKLLENWDQNDIKTLTGFKNQYPDLQIMVSMGGYNENSSTFSEVAADESLRQNLVVSVIALLEENSFDGFDLGWQFPGQRGGNEDDKTNFVTLLGDLKTALGAKNKILSATVSGRVDWTKISYDVPNVDKNVDMINLLAVDYHGVNENYTGHYSPLYASHLDEDKDLNVDSGVKYWLSEGADPSKINLGLGAYGRGFTLSVPNNNSLYASVVGGSKEGPYTQLAGFITFNEICEFNSEWEQTWDDEQEVPHIVNGDQWIGFDDRTSIELKLKYAHGKALGGVAFWSLDTDDFSGHCGGGFYPLLYTINLYW